MKSEGNTRRAVHVQGDWKLCTCTAQVQCLFVLAQKSLQGLGFVRDKFLYLYILYRVPQKRPCLCTCVCMPPCHGNQTTGSRSLRARHVQRLCFSLQSNYFIRHVRIYHCSGSCARVGGSMNELYLIIIVLCLILLIIVNVLIAERQNFLYC